MQERSTRHSQLTRSDLPAQLTADTLRELPIGVLRRLADPRNGILDAADQRAFDAAVRDLMRDAASRVSDRFAATDRHGSRRRRPPRPDTTDQYTSRADRQLQHLTRRLAQQVDLAEKLAPDVDWSFAGPALAAAGPTPPITAEAPSADSAPANPTPADPTPADSAPADSAPAELPVGHEGDDDTVDELGQQIADQVELVEVMTQIAEMSRRTYALEQQRDVQSTRTVFFGLVVSVAVLVSGWAPLVQAHDWADRLWILGLTLATCALGGLVYAFVRRRETTGSDGSDSAVE